MDWQRPPIHVLFDRFLEIYNRAMHVHKDRFPYKHIWEAAEQMQEDADWHLTVYDDEPKGDYVLCLQDKHLLLVQTLQPSDPSGWRMNLSYIKEVIENPQCYIDDPARLDWEWLMRRRLR